MIENEASWPEFLSEGERYLKTVKGAAGKPEKFTPEIIYNLVGMCIEKFFMAYFLKNDFLPTNHTLRDLIFSFRQLGKGELAADLEEKLVELDKFQEICSVENYSRRIPDVEDVPFFVDTCTETAEMLRSYIERGV